MRTRRRLFALVGVFVILARFGAPASAEPAPREAAVAEQPTVEGFVDELEAGLGSFGPVVSAFVGQAKAAAEGSAEGAAAGEVQAAHVHTDESKPDILELLLWLKGELPTLKPMLNEVLHDFDPVSAAMWEKMGPFMDYLQGELTTVLPILFNLLLCVHEVTPAWICNLLLNTVPGLLATFWPIVVKALPMVLGLVGKFFSPILDFLIGWAGGSAASVSVAAAGAAPDVTAAHLHLEERSPYVTDLLVWLAGELPTIIEKLLPVLYEARSVIAQAVVDAAPIFAWLAAQIDTILPPIVSLLCINGDDVIGLPLLCAVISLLMPIVEGVIQGVLGAVESFVSRLPDYAGSGTTTTTTTTSSSSTTSSSTTTTTSCPPLDLSCLFGSSAGDPQPIVNSGDGGPGGSAALAYGLLGLLMVSVSGGLYRLRKKNALGHVAGW